MVEPGLCCSEYQTPSKVPREWNFRVGEMERAWLYNPTDEEPTTHPA
jgi:hypothetical protein